MKTKNLVAGILLMIVTGALGATNDLTSALQKGLFEEEANHNLEAAAQAYQAVSARFDQDRKLAATAIFRLGEVYRKQNKTNEATAQYERIVREFSDQSTLATLSRQNLAGLRPNTQPALNPSEASNASPPEAAYKVLTLTAQIDRLKKMSPNTRRIAVQQSHANPVLTDLMKQLTSAEQRLTAMKQDRAPGHPEMLKAQALVETVSEQIDAQVGGVIKSLEGNLEEAKQALATNPGSASQTVTTDDEEKEIRRIQEIIRNSPDLINAPSGEDKLTPLCRAARNGHLRVAKFLLDGSAAIEAEKCRG